jgi:hypothetical protein
MDKKVVTTVLQLWVPVLCLKLTVVPAEKDSSIFSEECSFYALLL